MTLRGSLIGDAQPSFLQRGIADLQLSHHTCSQGAMIGLIPSASKLLVRLPLQKSKGLRWSASSESNWYKELKSEDSSHQADRPFNKNEDFNMWCMANKRRSQTSERTDAGGEAVRVLSAQTKMRQAGSHPNSGIGAVGS